MATFALVHGGQHGAWCWTFVEAELGSRGHTSIAVDLPVGDLTAGAARYAEVVAQATRDAGDELVLVGHSLGGLTIPLVPALRPVRRLVFLCAAYPEPGQSHFDVLAAEPARSLGSATRGHLANQGPPDHLSSADDARATFYDDVPAELQDWAISRLRRQSRTPHREVTPLVAWPDTPRTLIHAADDRAIPLELARRQTMRLFGVEPIVIPGGHSPFLTRPADVATLLEQAARG
jgi:pimeloyl-ACP methyl ester carboxylesterase